MSAIALHPGDNRESLRRLIDAGVRVHSVVTDPPYGLVSTTKRFGGDKAAPAKFGNDGAFARSSAGFMGSKWDGTGIERDPEFWALIWEILLPGGYCLAFSSARTGHWQACAMEMAGFIMHPFFGWTYGSGFPKAHNASKAIDRELGAERDRVAVNQTPGWQRNIGNTRPYMSDPNHATVSNEPSTAAAAAWQGWAYGAQSMKPALEPIYVGQKPFSEKNGALNLLRHGVGALNVDGCRVAGSESTRRTGAAEMGYHGGNLAAAYQTGSDTGRHPANLLHDGSPEVVAMFPDSKGQIAPVSIKPGLKTGRVYGAMSRVGEASADRRYTEVGSTNFAALPGMRREPVSSAARFFNSFPTEHDSGTEVEHPPLESLDADPLFYHAKATKADRAGSKHPTVKPIALMRWLVRLATPPGGTVLDPFGGSGTTGAAARAEGFDCILMEAEEQFVADIRRRFGLVDPSADPFADLFDLASDPFAELVA